jgi:hypothetical protein
VNGYDLGTFISPEPRAAGIRADPAGSGGGGGTRTPNSTTLCLNGDRFKVTARFETTSGGTGNANAEPLTDDTGFFWFFDPANVEAVVKVLRGCSLNERFWVFAGGLTDVEVAVTVSDMATGATKTYFNPLGTPFAPIQDTSAFGTCP